MKNRLKQLYRINVKSIVKLSDKVDKVITNDNYFILKKVDSVSKENVYIRLALSKIQNFNLPLKSVNNRYIEEIDHKYYILSYFYNDEANPLKELRLPFYIKIIALLHQNTNYPLKVNDGYFIESLDYIENKIMMIRDEIDSKMYHYERQDYHSPFEWYYISTYQVLNNALIQSQKYLDLLKEEFENLHSIDLSLTYQNYAHEHIILKEEKIISLENMNLAPSIYDLVDFVEKNYNEKIDISALLSQYDNINPLNLYQKYWLLALLFIPKLHQDNNDLVNIESLYLTINYLNLVEKIKSILLQTETE